MKPLFIIGYMACGKTTFGQALAEATGLKFIDLDHIIEERQNAMIREIFAEKGEDGFREIERDMLHEVASLHDTIISCGGGTPCFFNNMDHMNSQGTTLWLQTSEERLFSRLIVKRHTRPLLADRTDNEIRDLIKKQLEARSPFYSRASIIWHGDLLENRREIDDNISAFLKAFPILPANQARSRPLFSSQIRKMLLTKLQKTPTSQTN